MTDQVIVERADGIVTVSLNRPEKKNALTDAMYGAVADALEAAEKDTSVRVVLLRGEGDAFCAGNDMSDFASRAANRRDPTELSVFRMLKTLAYMKKPVVAAVQGPAIGIGTTILLHCDLVFVAADAQLQTPFVNLALVPEAASSLLLPARIGHVRAFSMFVLGQKIDGTTAAGWGLANAALPASEVQGAALEAARTLASRPPGAVAITKSLMRDGDALWAVMSREGSHFGERLSSPEAMEAFMAFLERRAPDFSKVA